MPAGRAWKRARSRGARKPPPLQSRASDRGRMSDPILPVSGDADYSASTLIRRLLTEQGLVHWKKYAVAFVLMAIAAGCTAFSAYLIGDVINQAYVNHNLAGIITLGFITVLLF